MSAVLGQAALPEPVSTEGLVPVSYSMIQFVRDVDNADEDSELPETEAPGDGEAVFGLDWMAVSSAASNHAAAIRMELWDQEPKARHVEFRGEWEELWEGSLSLSAPGVLRAWEVTGGPADWYLELPGSGPYDVRIYSGGRAAVQEACVFNEDEVVPYPDGIERYLVQLWMA